MRAVRGVIVGLFTALAACATPFSSASEPTDAQLRAALDQNRRSLEEVRQMFQQDSEERGVWSIGSGSPKDTACEDGGSRCIAIARWQQYSARLKRAGLRRVHTSDAPGIYFEISESRSPDTWIGGFRWRGLVYAPGHPAVNRKHDDTEKRVDLGGGWYSYLMTDD